MHGRAGARVDTRYDKAPETTAKSTGHDRCERHSRAALILRSSVVRVK